MQPSGTGVAPNPSNSSVPVPAATSALPPAAAPPARGPSRAVKFVVGAVVVAAIVVLAGVIFLSPASSSGPFRPVSFSVAESAATNVSSSTPGGPWTLLGATGVDGTTGVSTSVQWPGCDYISGTGFDSGRPYLGNYSSGQLANWLITYFDPGRTQFLVIEVDGGHASNIGVASGSCGAGVGPAVSSNVIDSTQVAAALLRSIQVERFLGTAVSANASYALVDLGGGIGVVWQVSYETCAIAASGPFAGVGSDVEATVNATTGRIVDLRSSLASSPSCAEPPATVPIGSVFGAEVHGLLTCPSGDTYVGNGCRAGDYAYEIGIAYVQTAVTFERVLFEVETATGGVVNLGPVDGGFAIVNLSGAVLAESTPGPLLSMTGWTFPVGSPATNTTPLNMVNDLIVIDMGTSAPSGEGYLFVTNGVGSLSGSATIDLP